MLRTLSPAPAQSVVLDQVAEIPWYVWCSAIAVDIHHGRTSTGTSRGTLRSGRDTFWTPAHLCIHFGAILAGLSSTYLILTTTFGKNHVGQGSAVKDLGRILRALRNLRLAPGAGLRCLTSAPFDDWWHSAFGLDVQIISPPHVVLLILGIFILVLGGLLLIIAEMNLENLETRR